MSQNIRLVSIGDLVVDYYYFNSEIVGIFGGMSCHNIIANLADYGFRTGVFGVCGNDELGNIAKKSLEVQNIDTSNVNSVSSISYSEKVITIMNGYSKININATIGSVSTKGSYITIGTITNDLTIQNEKSRVGFIRNNSTNTFYPILCRITKNKELQINVPYEIIIGENTNTLILPFDSTSVFSLLLSS